jgi:Fe-S cluster assembly protein SufD
LIVLEGQAEAKVVESYVSLGGQVLVDAVTEIVLGPGARLEHVRVQDESLESWHVSTVAVDQARDSVYTSTSASFGASVARNEINVWSGGENAETWLNGMYVGTGTQVLDTHTRIDHAVPHCNSFEVYKGILDERAEGVFNGKIFVYEDAQKTDAKQTNQAILLSPEASVNTKPQLEIFADDVKCTHGATVGQIAQEAKFYMQSRGIPAEEAQALLVYAFAAEVLEKITIEAVREALEARLFAKLGRKTDD